ncbi:formate hydrogenlyase subunit 5 [Klebsiella michiganensis]|uniref:Formate hydrogenlyase subunit 5 n=1 Tax=Klebsiella michiganensis TaxID=1134687 RepID=A0A7H4PMK8_9ENTR|nr:formate hydrogenlyase subunit 5 [Klebsiella michiganensis]
MVEFLYYKQGGWLSVLFGNDERKLNGHYAVYYVLSMEQGTKCWITVRVEVDANKTRVSVGDAAGAGGGMGRARSARHVRPGAGRPAGRTPAGAAGRLAG